MSFLLDTCAISELTRPTPNQRVAAWFEAQDGENLYLSVLTLGEIEKGIAALPAGRKKNALTSWLATLRSTYASRIVSIDAAIASLWGKIAARAEREGISLGVIDGLIGATALQLGYTIVTRNGADFVPTGATVLDVWET